MFSDICSVFAEGYLVTNDPIVRRLLLNSIKKLCDIDQQIFTEIIKFRILIFLNYENFAENKSQTHDREVWLNQQFKTQPLSTKSIGILMLLQMPFGSEILEKTAESIVDFFVDAFKFTTSKILDTENENKKDFQQNYFISGDIIEHYNTIQQIGKVILHLTSKVGFKKFGSVNTGHFSENIQKKISNIIPTANDLLYHKEEALGIDAREIAALIVITSLDKLNQTSIDQYIKNLSEIQKIAELSGNATPIICISRAIITCMNEEVVLYSQSLSKNSSSILDTCYLQVSDLCGNPKLAPGIKVLAFESLNLWLNKIYSTMKFANSLRVPESDKDLTDVYKNDLLFENTDYILNLKSSASNLGNSVIYNQSSKIMDLLWSYWDDPIEAVQNKVKSLFEILLDIGIYMENFSKKTELNKDLRYLNFSNQVLDQVMSIDWTQKAKYSLLSALVKRLGPLSIISKEKGVIVEALSRMENTMLAPRISQLISSMLTSTLDELDTYQIWALPISQAILNGSPSLIKMIGRHVLPIAYKSKPELVGLLVEIICQQQELKDNKKESESSKNIAKIEENEDLFPNIYEEGYELELDNDYFDVSSMVQVNSSSKWCLKGSNRVNAMILILSIAKNMGMVSSVELDGDKISYIPKNFEEKLGPHLETIHNLLLDSVYNHEWLVRADLLELLCSSFKASEPLINSEVELIKVLLKETINSPNADFRQRQYSTLITWAGKLQVLYLSAKRIIYKFNGYGKELQENRESHKIEAENVVCKVTEVLKWWYELSISNIYPGANFVRSATGIQWLSIILKFFEPEALVASMDISESKNIKDSIRMDGSSILPWTNKNSLIPIISVLMNDTFQTNRDSAFELLNKWPFEIYTGGESSIYDAVPELIQMALERIYHTRSNENECGAQLLCFVFSKFVLKSKLEIEISDSYNSDYPKNTNFLLANLSQSLSEIPEEKSKLIRSVLFFVGQLVNILNTGVEHMKQNILKSALSKPLNGVILAIKLIFEKINWNELTNLLKNTIYGQIWRETVTHLISLLGQIKELVMVTLANPSPEGNIPSSFKETELAIQKISIENSENDNSFGSAFESTDIYDNMDNVDVSNGLVGVGPKHQVILSFCWRAVKEISGLLSTIGCYLPASDMYPKTENDTLGFDGGAIQPRYIISEDTVVQIGNDLFLMLTSIRHRGAFAAVHLEFARVCKRIYTSPNQKVSEFISVWLKKCVDTMVTQSVSITRRSAGWPYCLLALITSDQNCSIQYLPGTVAKLVEIAIQPVSFDKTENNNTDLPQVHAINMLRILFDDKTLTSDMIPFTENCMFLALNGLESNYWAIRNVCGLLYTSLMRRLFGIKKTKTERARENGITARELFTKFPGLYPLILSKLKAAVKQMDDITHEFYSKSNVKNKKIYALLLSNDTGITSPALYPCLILLSRLQLPSESQITSTDIDLDLEIENPLNIETKEKIKEGFTNTSNIKKSSLIKDKTVTNAMESINLNSQDEISKYLFSKHISLIPFIKLVLSCSKSPVMKTRLMASKALSSMLPSYLLTKVVTELLNSIIESSESIVNNFESGADSTLKSKNDGNLPGLIDYNDIHGKICQLYDIVSDIIPYEKMTNNKVSIELLDSVVIPKLLYLLEINLSEKLNCEIIRAGILKIILLIVGNSKWFSNNLLEQIRDSGISKTIHSNSSAENSLPHSTFLLAKSLLENISIPLFMNNVDTSTKQLSKFDDTVLNIPGGSDTILDCAKITLKLLDFQIESEKTGNFLSAFGSCMNITKIIENMSTDSIHYEVQILLVDWIKNLVPKLLSLDKIAGVSTLVVFETIVRSLTNMAFTRSSDQGIQMNKDPIVASYSLNTISLLLMTFSGKYDDFSALKNCGINQDIWKCGISVLKNEKSSLVIRCSLLIYLSSISRHIAGLASHLDQDSSDTLWSKHSNPLMIGDIKKDIGIIVDSVQSWSDENNTLPKRFAACNAAECLYYNNYLSKNDFKLLSPVLNAKLILVMFDLLYDDDVDIRYKSCSMVSKVLVLEKSTFNNIKQDQNSNYKLLCNKRAAEELISNYLNIEILESNIETDYKINTGFHIFEMLLILVQSKNELLGNFLEAKKSKTLFEKEPSNVYKEQIEISKMIYDFLFEYLNSLNKFISENTISKNTLYHSCKSKLPINSVLDPNFKPSKEKETSCLKFQTNINTLNVFIKKLSTGTLDKFLIALEKQHLTIESLLFSPETQKEQFTAIIELLLAFKLQHLMITFISNCSHLDDNVKFLSKLNLDDSKTNFKAHLVELRTNLLGKVGTSNNPDSLETIHPDVLFHLKDLYKTVGIDFE
ncbi:hypothetical protein BB558_005166 [Smittium angustum]|uniref:Uncharacterized protein n=1 Tax=Smittium angustum TaxID=133377 RepID=A0A2U1J1H1_SMIAN|nr:hypothetical protein BB558_006224 [Smittium angustum]PVZ98832.1 hypothetical protein BB558_005166 [Smittium angustum]